MIKLGISLSLICLSVTTLTSCQLVEAKSTASTQSLDTNQVANSDSLLQDSLLKVSLKKCLASQPILADAILPKICGQDNKVYADSCTATILGKTSPMPGQSCMLPDTLSTEVCSSEYKPVCGNVSELYPYKRGASLVTFANECVAKKKGAKQIIAGECNANVNRDSLNSAEYDSCLKTQNGLNLADTSKILAKTTTSFPQTIPLVLPKVCGQNGGAYYNRCEAVYKGFTEVMPGEGCVLPILDSTKICPQQSGFGYMGYPSGAVCADISQIKGSSTQLVTTFLSRCDAEVRGAKFLYDGECK